MLEFKPDYERSKERIDAFWERELIDRPVVQFGLLKPAEERVPLPVSNHTTAADRWLDSGYQAELKLAQLANRGFLGDTMPVAWPNLGPEVFAAFYGCPIHFGDYGTSWTEPILDGWEQARALQLDWQSPYLLKLYEMTDALLELGRGKFITGMTDWHPAGSRRTISGYTTCSTRSCDIRGSRSRRGRPWSVKTSTMSPRTISRS
jgi:hypothetical protein